MCVERERDLEIECVFMSRDRECLEIKRVCVCV